jgi:hypothetical protein
MSDASESAKLALWTKRLAEYQLSKLPVAQFCHSIGCSIPTFYQWKRKVQAKAAKPTAFLEVRTEASLAISIQLRSGIVISLPIEAIDSLPSILERVA